MNGMPDPQPDPEHEPPFMTLLGLRPGLSSAGKGSASMPIREDHRQEAGVVQGGLIVTLADYAFFRAVKSVLKPGESSATVELKVNFIAPAREGVLTATAQLVSRGRRIIVGEVEVTDAEDTLIARCLGTFLVTQPL